MRRKRRRFRAGRRRILWMLVGAIAGIVLAVPVSYTIQPGIVRWRFNLAEYCREVIDGLPDAVQGEPDLLGCGRRVAATAAIMGALGAYAGFWLGPGRKRRG